jgi:hypothetical protein
MQIGRIQAIFLLLNNLIAKHTRIPPSLLHKLPRCLTDITVALVPPMMHFYPFPDTLFLSPAIPLTHSRHHRIARHRWLVPKAKNARPHCRRNPREERRERQEPAFDKSAIDECGDDVGVTRGVHVDAEGVGRGGAVEWVAIYLTVELLASFYPLKARNGYIPSNLLTNPVSKEKHQKNG